MAARSAFPATTTALLILMFGAPLAVPGRAVLPPCVALACVFFWSLYRPAAMPPVVVFLLGALLDLLSFSPLGVGVLVLLFVYGTAVRWRRKLVRQGFVLVWLAFVAVSAAASALTWALTSLLWLRVYPAGPAVLEAGFAAGLYPALATLLVRAHQTLAEPERA
jgi:rod shape-determining protein MreD